MQNYESNFWSVKQYTSWPFSEVVFPEGTILDFTIVAPQRILLQKIEYNIITFSYVNGDYYASCTITGDNQVFPIMNTDIVGWIEIGKWYYITKTVNVDILYGINISWTPIGGRSIILNGYNAEFTVEETTETLLDKETTNGATVSCSFYRGAGIGEFCGNEIEYNGIYTINGSGGDSLGNYRLYNSGFITISTDENKIELDMILSDDICIRQGNKGPKGPKGPSGAKGRDGQDAVEVIISFDPSCRGNDI